MDASGNRQRWGSKGLYTPLKFSTNFLLDRTCFCCSNTLQPRLPWCSATETDAYGRPTSILRAADTDVMTRLRMSEVVDLSAAKGWAGT